jgi:prevent-host-death family protein
MEVTTSVEFGRKIGHYQDRALVEPVMVTRNGRERVVLLSADEYKRLKPPRCQPSMRTSMPS